MFAPESVEQLQKAGFDFQRHEEFGILPNDFAELMITSGLVLSHDTKWISFHRYATLHFLLSVVGNACHRTLYARVSTLSLVLPPYTLSRPCPRLLNSHPDITDHGYVSVDTILATS